MDPEVLGALGKTDGIFGSDDRGREIVLQQHAFDISEGKAHLAIAIGCTGGRHRSVAIAEALASRYRERDDLEVEVAHRDVGRLAR